MAKKRSKVIKSLIIDRAKWGKGTLLRPDGKMCCLGHLGIACGILSDQFKDQTMPDHLETQYNNLYPPAFRGYHPSEADGIAADINDSLLPKPEKERRLIILFKAYGIKLSFIGDRKLAGV